MDWGRRRCRDGKMGRELVIMPSSCDGDFVLGCLCAVRCCRWRLTAMISRVAQAGDAGIRMKGRQTYDR